MSKTNNKLEQRLKKQWTVENTSTIIEWISASNLNILLLNTYLLNLRSVLRFSTLWSLVISSVTSTISVTQFTIDESDNMYLTYAIKILIFFTSVTTSLITGYIKVEKIQETIEVLEEHKKNWLTFMNSLTSELQVGIEFRNDATVLINAKKDEYNAVSSRQIEIPPNIHKQVSQFLVTKRNVEKHIREVKERSDFENRQYQQIFCGANLFEQFCCSICCCFYWFKYCCKSRCCSKTENDYNMEKIATKLSLFHTINKDLTNELLELMNVFQDEVKALAFDTQNDMFNYEIMNNRYMKDMVAEKRGLTVIRLKLDDQEIENEDVERGIKSSMAQSETSQNSYRTSLTRQYDAKQMILKAQLMRNTIDIKSPNFTQTPPLPPSVSSSSPVPKLERQDTPYPSKEIELEVVKTPEIKE